MKIIGNILLFIGIGCVLFFGFQFVQSEWSQDKSLAESQKGIDEGKTNTQRQLPKDFSAEKHTSFATLKIPKLNKTLPIIEGTDPDSLAKGVGHLTDSVFPGQNEQIVLSGHRDTVFRSFGDLEIGDTFIVNMPYNTFKYKIKNTDIVPEDDTSIIREMGEEVLVVTTCYPFSYIGSEPERFIAYAHPLLIDLALIHHLSALFPQHHQLVSIPFSFRLLFLYPRFSFPIVSHLAF